MTDKELVLEFMDRSGLKLDLGDSDILEDMFHGCRLEIANLRSKYEMLERRVLELNEDLEGKEAENKELKMAQKFLDMMDHLEEDHPTHSNFKDWFWGLSEREDG